MNVTLCSGYSKYLYSLKKSPLWYSCEIYQINYKIIYYEKTYFTKITSVIYNRQCSKYVMWFVALFKLNIVNNFKFII